MRFTRCVWAGVAALAMAQAADAASPKVAGKYAVMIFEQCTSSFNYANDSFFRSAGGAGPGVKSINPTKNGEFGIEVSGLDHESRDGLQFREHARQERCTHGRKGE